MSDRLANAFDFSGRLSRGGRARLERKVMLIGSLGVVGPVFLLTIGTPRPVAAVPALLLIPLLMALAASGVRRLHDVGRHAHRVYLKRLVRLAITITPLGIAGAFPALPIPVLWSLVGLSGVALLASLFIRDLGWTEWRRGDPGPNRFGPPPE